MTVFKGRLHDSVANNVLSTKIDCGINEIVLTLSQSNGLALLEVRFELTSKTIWLSGHGIGVSGNPAFHFPVGRIA